MEEGRSFKRFSPKLSGKFFWHYHPEYELVYVEASNGIRHVGQHVSGYLESDLVLIGPNIPHLNFDYGLNTSYKQVVVQLQEGFLGNALLQSPELSPIQGLFEKAYLGLSFSGAAKSRAVAKLKAMEDLNPFDQLICLLEIFEILSRSLDVQALNDRDTSVKLFMNDKIRMGAIYQYIHTHYNQTPDVHEVAENVHLSTPAFCRYFKKQTKMTFTDFVNQYRITQAKTLLLQNIPVSDACFQVGFNSLSYFSRCFKNITGQKPRDFKNLSPKS